MVVRASPNQHPSTRGHTHASQQEVIDEWVLDGGGSVVRRPPTRRGHTEERVWGMGMTHRTTHPPRERERHMHRIPEVHTPRENSRGVSDCGRKPHEDRGDVVWIVWGGWCGVCVWEVRTPDIHNTHSTLHRQPTRGSQRHAWWASKQAHTTSGTARRHNQHADVDWPRIGDMRTLRADPTAQRCQTIHIPIHTQRCGYTTHTYA